MKHPSLAEELYSDARTFAFRYFCADIPEKCLDIRPLYVRTCRMGKYKFKYLVGFALHDIFVCHKMASLSNFFVFYADKTSAEFLLSTRFRGARCIEINPEPNDASYLYPETGFYGHWFSRMRYHTVASTRIMKIFSQESFSLIIPIATAGTFFVVK